jgi:dienelactone hydrolase
MRIAALALLLALVGCGGATAPSGAQTANAAAEQNAVYSETISIDGDGGTDPVVIYAVRRTPPHPKAVIVLFHQAGSSKDEYAPIAPRLNAAGYATLAIDQRSGGDMFGPNQTVADLGRPATYLEAKDDLETALTFAKSEKLPVILWGSSYSASLAFLVAAGHPGEVAALLAFSPDEYFDGKPSVHAAAAKLTIPVFVTSAQDPGEIAAAKSLLDAVPGRTKVQFVPTHGGVHGSSILRADRNAKGADEAWAAVLAFLARVTTASPATG